MANLTICELAVEVPGAAAFDLFGVAPEQGTAFTVHYVLEREETTLARRGGLSLFAEGFEFAGDPLVPTRMLLYDWQPGKGDLMAQWAFIREGVPAGHWDLTLVAGESELARITVGVRN